MIAYAVRRVVTTVPVMGVVALFVFSLLYIAPGDPAIASKVLAAQGKNLPSVALTMVLFGLGAALPMLLLGTLSREVLMRWRDRMINLGKGVKAALGLVLLLVGVAILTGYDKALETQLVALSPNWLTDITTRF